ncbi:MAG: hypothetical protein ACM359_00165 [Bacillota bacterium]
MIDNDRPVMRKERRKKLSPLASLPEKWQKEYQRILPLAIAKYSGQWGGEDECRYVIHSYVVDCWRAEQKTATPTQGLLFGA